MIWLDHFALPVTSRVMFALLRGEELGSDAFVHNADVRTRRWGSRDAALVGCTAAILADCVLAGVLDARCQGGVVRDRVTLLPTGKPAPLACVQPVVDGVGQRSPRSVLFSLTRGGGAVGSACVAGVVAELERYGVLHAVQPSWTLGGGAWVDWRVGNATVASEVAVELHAAVSAAPQVPLGRAVSYCLDVLAGMRVAHRCVPAASAGLVKATIRDVTGASWVRRSVRSVLAADSAP